MCINLGVDSRLSLYVLLFMIRAIHHVVFWMIRISLMRFYCKSYSTHSTQYISLFLIVFYISQCTLWYPTHMPPTCHPSAMPERLGESKNVASKMIFFYIKPLFIGIA